MSHPQFKLEKTSVDVEQLIRKALAECEPELVRARLTSETQFPPVTPTISADPHRLSQILHNLIGNAINHTPAGGRINVSVDVMGNHVAISVVDTGAGIHPDKLKGIFDVFEMYGPSSSHSGGGMGIGLSIVQTLVRLHGGSVEAFSDGVDQGSTFRVLLPL